MLYISPLLLPVWWASLTDVAAQALGCVILTPSVVRCPMAAVPVATFPVRLTVDRRWYTVGRTQAPIVPMAAYDLSEPPIYR